MRADPKNTTVSWMFCALKRRSGSRYSARIRSGRASSLSRNSWSRYASGCECIGRLCLGDRGIGDRGSPSQAITPGCRLSGKPLYCRFNTMQPNLDTREGIYVARQPILDASGQVFGYELLYRAGADATSCVDRRDLAAARVLNDAELTLGLETL